MYDPKLDSPLRPNIAKLYKTNKRLHDKRANQHAVKHADAQPKIYHTADIPTIILISEITVVEYFFENTVVILKSMNFKSRTMDLSIANTVAILGFINLG